MERFLERHQGRVIGVLSGFDRVLFRGTLLSLSHLNGLEAFLATHRILYKDFGGFCLRLSGEIKEHARAWAAQHDRPFRYLESSAVSKERIAQDIRDRDRVTNGLICVLSCVEPCQSYNIVRDREKKRLRLVPAQRKGLHVYFYYQDREFGLMHVRLQTWLPFGIQVCLNGREYLARRLDRAGIDYEQRDNCFARIDDLPRAQAMLDCLTHRRWERFLDVLARRVNPLLGSKSKLALHGYYWSIRQAEYATDVMFRGDADLRAVYPALVRHAMQSFSSDDVLRFLGRGTNSRFSGEITTDLKRGPDGIRIKHRVEENSIKMYDKQGSVLRIETTINNPRRFRVRREVTRKGQRCIAWVPMRKGVADIARRVDLCRAANERYLEALAVVGWPAPTHRLLDPVSRRVVREGRPYRALRPLTREETDLFRVILRGEHFIQGFRNRDVRRILAPSDEGNSALRRKASARTSRMLRLLRAHHLIKKVPSTSYYRVTEVGQRVMTTALRLREIDVQTLAA
jgi:hypothetical protein